MYECRYHFNPETEKPHIYDHGVSEQEVEEVLGSPLDVHESERNSRVAMGKTVGGRFLKVVYVPDDDGIGIFVITAYDLVGKPLHALRRRLRRRSK